MAKISIPQNNLKTYDVIHIFAQSGRISTQYLYENTPPDIKKNNVLIYLEPIETYRVSKIKINEVFSELGLTIKSESLIGVSETALKVLGAYNQNFKFVGLIDPLLKNNNLKLTFNNKTNIVYNTKNWVDLPLNQTLQVRLANKLTSNTQKEEKNLSTIQLVEYFFNKYKNSLS